MARPDNRPPRLTVEVDEEVYNKLRDNIRWGAMKPLMNVILKDLADLLENNDSNLIIGAIMSEDITLKDFIKKNNIEQDG